MQTKVSTKGQVVLPGPLRRRLGIQAGDPLDVLTPRRRRRMRVKITTDPVTGLPVFSAGPDAPVLSSKEVDEILATFP